MAEGLKASPFCGHAVSRDFVVDEYNHDICGDNSDTCGMCEQTFRMTDEEWNSRPVEDSLRAEVSALKAELARYKEPLTESEGHRVVEYFGDYFAMFPYAMRSATHWDIAIRAIRAAREGAR